jgi:hypothetical protein
VATNSPNQAPSPLDIALSEEPSESSYAAPSASMAPLGLAVLLGDDLSDGRNNSLIHGHLFS